MMLVLLLVLLGETWGEGKDSSSTSSLLATVGCDGRSGKKELLDMSVALLHAHRCVVKDVAVEVPVPENTIPDLVIPSHIVVPRCTGLCLQSIGSSCYPRKTKLESHNVVVYVNSTPFCTTIELEHHRGPCRCDCEKTDKTCSSLSNRHVFSPDSCSCLCDPAYLKEKISCENKTDHFWNQETCSCSCSSPVTCYSGMKWDDTNCACVQSENECVLNQANLNAEGRYNLYPLYLTCIVVVLIILIITSLCFTLSHRYRGGPTYTQHTLRESRNGPPTAYTITLCSTQNLDKAT